MLTSFEAFKAVVFLVEAFRVVTPYNVVVGNNASEVRAVASSSPHPEDGGNIDLRNVAILSQYYTASQPRTHRLGSCDVNCNKF
jgi:hypothetical protein